MEHPHGRRCKRKLEQVASPEEPGEVDPARKCATRPLRSKRVLVPRGLRGHRSTRTRRAQCTTVAWLEHRDAGLYHAARRSSILTCTARFPRLRLWHCLDPASAASASSLPLPLLRSRTRVDDVLCADGLLITLASSGACAVFDACRSFEPLGFLNTSDKQQVIRSVFHNARRRELLTVSVISYDHFTSLTCCAVPLRSIRHGCVASDSYTVFERTDRLSCPGFVEFDDVNQVILTNRPLVYSSHEPHHEFRQQPDVDVSSRRAHCYREDELGPKTMSLYRVYSLDTYELLHEVSDSTCNSSILEVKLGPGLMMVVYKPCSSHLPLRILDVYTGELLRDMCHLLHKDKRLEFVENFNHKVLIKQEGCYMQLLDIFDSSVKEIDLPTPKSFVLLFEARVFLAFRKVGTPQVYNESGALVATFADNELVSTSSVTKQSSSCLCVSSDQRSIVSYCKRKEWDSSGVTTQFQEGSVNVSDVRTGESLAKISDDGCGGEDASGALEGVTALCHDEARGMMVVGMKDGRLRVFR